MPQPSLIETLLASPNLKSIQVSLARNEFLVKAGKIESNLYFVEDGALRIFYLGEFEEHTIRFGYKGSVLSSLASFLRGTASEFYIQAIRKTVVKVIQKKEFEQFLLEHPECYGEYQALLEEVIIQQLEREIDLLTHSPMERLNRVLTRSPQLFQEIPAKYIASYLRMSPETLSRIRKS